ncbi:4'-phosphopantetheinyl transferase family protein [Pseudoalteromonas sp. ZZD1]|uniref:4'-phosphopantetheinyl transferase family protein n=1 Tax=Pseudoalteromonas sp. ZZD1 TaxID=3139395 RepID=UPI003BAC6B4C
MLNQYFDQYLTVNPFNASEINAQSLLLLNAESINFADFALDNLLSPFEQAVIERRKSSKAKQEYLATRLLLKFLVKHCFTEFADTPAHHISSEFDEQSSKLLLHIKNTNTVLSSCLSHSNGFVGAALNIERVEFGFDIEKVSLKRPFAKLAKHFYHQQEVDLITQTEQCAAQRFFRIWTLKEALAKATSRPIAQLLSPHVFTELATANLNAKSTIFEGFDISIVNKKSTDWQCFYITDLQQLSSAFELK